MKRGTRQGGLHRQHRGVEAFQMADLQNALGAARQFDQTLALPPPSRSSASRPARSRRRRENPWRPRSAAVSASRCSPHRHARAIRDSRHRPQRPIRPPPPSARCADGSATPTRWEFGRLRIFLRMKSAQVADADHRRAHQGGRVSPPLAAGAVILAQLQGGAADDRQRRAAQSTAVRATPSTDPADSDQSIMPTAKITPTPMKTQGLASYSVCGVQERMVPILQRAGGRGADSFTIRVHGDQEILRASRIDQPLVRGTGGCRAGLAARRRADAGPDLLRRRRTLWAATRAPASGACIAACWSGLGQASIASWIVLLGPYGLYLLFQGPARLVAGERAT